MRETEPLTQEHRPIQNNETHPITIGQTTTLRIQKGTNAFSRPSVHTYDTQDKYHPFNSIKIDAVDEARPGASNCCDKTNMINIFFLSSHNKS